jgi:hypothetical protein
LSSGEEAIQELKNEKRLWTQHDWHDWHSIFLALSLQWKLIFVSWRIINGSQESCFTENL